MIVRNAALKDKNTFGFDISASIFIEINEKADIESLWKTNLLSQSSPLFLGGGSNILFTKNYPGIVVFNHLKGRNILFENDDVVIVDIGGGENWHETVLWAVSCGWGGIENLALIPGSVGAAPIQNIGAYGIEIEQVLESVEVFDLMEGKWAALSREECQFGYRDSIFKRQAKGRYFISSVQLKLHKHPTINAKYGDIESILLSKNIQEPTISDIANAVIAIRQSKLPDPAVLGNCGSFFKNPIIENALFFQLQQQFPEMKSFPSAEGFVKTPAAWLIEKAGWKGLRRGNCGVHERQALVLVNYGGATGQEILQLAKDIQQSVESKFGITLEMEVNIR